ncbi:Nitrous oxide reductase maturation protein, outer-membrane lipoprotein NosL [hydrothermal vent metagenome]|uniref:Nitrous oxide reductase maturation protein, outer-membrane lipoprotein NosL n=1 Tax=hydrothermal vent metagenome TaxID=652676 RepID=A0A3B0R1L6_9ZZZZ
MKNAKHFHELYVIKSTVNKTLKQIIIPVVFLVTLNCSNAPQPINYGQEGCRFCKMTIVDKLHAAQIVTKKGKSYTFDATECMVNFLKEFDTSKIKLYLTTNYSNPEELIDATSATFLISKNIPSPMGAFISGFKNKEDAIKTQSEQGGDLYTWNTLLEHLKNSNK